MFSNHPIALAVLMTALLAACAAPAQVRTAQLRADQVRMDQVPSAQLGSYKTFAFHDTTVSDIGRYTSMLTQRLQESTRAELEKQGYTYSEAAPDLRVKVLVVVESRPEIRNSGFMRRWPYAPEIVTYQHGRLAIDLVDSRKRAVIWQGVTQGRIDGQLLDSPADTGDAAERAVKQIFASFPQAVAVQ